MIRRCCANKDGIYVPVRAHMRRIKKKDEILSEAQIIFEL